ncbi:flagellar hook-length control protein FliK [Vibrio brasiliensis]|uniref:Flagellar hook-length control protein FliK n=1 Tax=Vibrio brasiliensis LMG 20546 TaxID=945543 RepID=E8LU45_9VIBR|nr:flagellar hook-length control protein FliK [Vibrio brasiliensis]EGA65710.1 flagellar hook-length control protein FliK [Vibrio brasiliensis LMG 20546]
MNSISTLPSGEGKASGQNATETAIHQARSFGQSGQPQPFQLHKQALSGQNVIQTAEQPTGLLDEELATTEGAETQALLNGAEAIVNVDPRSVQQHRSEAQGMSARFAQKQGLTSGSITNSLTDSLRQASQQHSAAIGLAETATVKTPVAIAQADSILAQSNPASLLQAATPAPAQLVASPNSLIATSGAAAQGAEWAAVKIDTGAGKWGEQMMQVLHDRVTLQAQQNMQEAKIRLDPPELGKLDLLVRVDGDRLSVQINANAAATREALIQVSERLRAELQNQNFVHVDVNVGSGDSQQQGSNQHYQSDGHIFSARDSSFVESSGSQSEHWLSTQA